MGKSLTTKSRWHCVERARMIEILCSGLEGQMYSIDNPHILLNHTAVATDRSRVANASSVGLEPPLLITALLILRVTVSVD